MNRRIVLFLGVAVLLAGSYLTLDKLGDTLESQLTSRFIQAVEQLRSNDLEIRLGGIYALERIAAESERDHGPIMDILTAYVRTHAPWREGSEPAPPTLKADIQTILKVLGRRSRTYKRGESQRLDLRATDLRRANLSGAFLEGAILSEAHLEEANLSGAHFSEAILRKVHLSQAVLASADLEEAFLGQARLNGANLSGANLRKAYLMGASLASADLLGADLTDAYGLTWEQVNTARRDNRTRFPDYLRGAEPAKQD